MNETQNNNLTKKERRDLRRKEKEENRNQKEKSKKTNMIAIWTIVGLMLVAGIGSIVFLAAKSSSFDGTVSEPALLALAGDDWTKGGAKAKAVLVEYSDFQCPACAYFMPIVEKLTADFPDDLKIVYRHFPLPQHKNAKIAAYASEAAGAQGKFFEMADKIFEQQKDWENSSEENALKIFKNSAIELNLDMKKFEESLDSEEIKNAVQNNYKDGMALNINYTPTFYLNGNKIVNPKNYDEFKKMIENEINK